MKRAAPASFATTTTPRGKRKLECESPSAMEFDLDDDAVPDTNAVVKVFTIHSDPNYALPWSTKAQSSSTSTGFAIRGPKGQKWLLTNAHSVENHAVVQVRRRGGEEKFVAEVLCEGPDCDLALLSVEEKRFWEGLTPLSFSKDPPRLREDQIDLVDQVLRYAGSHFRSGDLFQNKSFL